MRIIEFHKTIIPPYCSGEEQCAEDENNAKYFWPLALPLLARRSVGPSNLGQ